MKLQCFSCRTSIVISKSCFSSGELTNRFQVRNYFPSTYQSADYGGAEFLSKLLDRRWTLPDPSSKLNQVIISNVEDRLVGALQWANCFSLVKERGQFSGLLEKDNNQQKSFYIVRDDLLHPLINGNKARKLDALLPLVEDQSVTDAVTCGGCQSAHAAATAVLFAERGLKAHLLLRGEQPETLTGYNLVSTMYGNVTYVARSIYADREKMMRNYADLVAGSSNVVRFSDILSSSSTYQEHAVSKSVQMDTCRSAENHPRKIVIINEGAGDAVALLGLIRLVEYLSQDHLLGKQRAINFVVDAGTGTTAIGLGLGAAYLGLPWEITAVMLADTIDGYKHQEKRLISDFNGHFNSGLFYHSLDEVDGGIVRWVERCHPRKFGNILEGEVEACKKIAQSTGILVDPVYTLAAWEMATVLCQKEDKDVVMLHTGGTLGMFGLAQRKTDMLMLRTGGILGRLDNSEIVRNWMPHESLIQKKVGSVYVRGGSKGGYGGSVSDSEGAAMFLELRYLCALKSNG